MKKIMLLFAFGVFLAQAEAQVIQVREVPGPVVTTFQSSYPAATKVEWYRIGPNYEAIYNVNDNDMYVTYSPAGKVIETGEGVAALDRRSARFLCARVSREDGYDPGFRDLLLVHAHARRNVRGALCRALRHRACADAEQGHRR